MDRFQIIVTVISAVATLLALVVAIRRAVNFYHNHQYATKVEKSEHQGLTDTESRLDVRVTLNVFRGQILRVVAYAGILAIFVSPFVIGTGPGARFPRTVIAIGVLICFAAEETYLDRARERWLRNGHG